MDIQGWLYQTFGWIQWNEAFLQGALGGSVLGLGRLIVTIIGMDHESHPTKYGQLIASHILAAVLFGLLGGVMAFAFEGRAGSFMQGISAMALLGILAGTMLPVSPGKRSADTPSTPLKQESQGMTP
ncbi:hypothetical protein CXX84_03980 [Arthrobacter sp. AFG7.2]|uniref:hypothetical protein n=1 Tax=Arthrobacter sp. AFG7.2 TaxID=1688693 RepID=UPI000C9EAF72|nr:hypothetical protein [Arthrobacter sp. AFG7.2]PNI09432.1 hypothetical protein CXX84_03980 [Arthrobacter sp. AFG7.2]